MNKLRVLGLCLIFVSLTACASAGAPFSGQVLETGTRKPIADAHVFLDWDGEISAWADSQSVCIHAEGTITDQQGRYRTQAWSEETKHGERMGSGVPTMEPYKPGYVMSYSSSEWAKEYKKGILLMEPFKGSNQERLQYLFSLADRVQCYGTDEKSLFQMLRAIYLEARTIAVSDQEKRNVGAIRHAAALVWHNTQKGAQVSLTPDEIETLIRNDNYLSEQLNGGSLQPEKEQSGVSGTVLPPPKLRAIQIQKAP